MVLLGFRHGFRASELVALKWDQVNLKEGWLSVRRRKNGDPCYAPALGA